MGATNLTLTTLFEAAYRRHRGRIAIEDEGVQASFEELGHRAERVGAALRAGGLEVGDVAVLIGANSLEWVEAEHAVWAAGLVRNALSWRLHPEEVVAIVNDCGAKVLFCDPERAAALAPRRADLPSVQRLVVLGDELVEGAEPLASLRACPDAFERPRVQPDDLAAIIYTSGTTGKPKGVMTTHANWVAMTRNLLWELPPIAPGDVVLQATPQSHMAGYVAPAYLIGGATQRLAAAFDPAAVALALAADEVTVLPVAPSMLYAVLDAIEGPSVGPRLRSIPYGGSAIAPARLAAARVAFGEVFTQLYGASEAMLPVAALPPWAHADERAHGSAGYVTPSVEVELRSADGTPVGAGEDGEIWVRGENVMVGYLNQPEETARVLEDGWFRTGDVGRFDGEGRLFIVDRAKDMIVSGGFNIYPREIEEAIAELPDVREVAVVGMSDPRWGEVVRAVVVADPAVVSEEDVIAACERRLARYKKPKSVVFADSLPKTPSGKVRRRDLREDPRNLG